MTHGMFSVIFFPERKVHGKACGEKQSRPAGVKSKGLRKINLIELKSGSEMERRRGPGCKCG
jgi:hypothetical protein